VSQTPNLSLPYIEAAQAQKHVTHNEALRAIDAIMHISVADRDLLAPPFSPPDGVRYMVAASATGAWAGHAGEIAAWQDGAWAFYPLQEGWTLWVEDEDVFLISASAGLSVAMTTTQIIAALAIANLDNLGRIGVATSADAVNKLAVASAASLFTHSGAGHQHKINKNATSDTASTLFQSDFSGRAEMGLLGSDDFELKVSPDGAAWIVALRIDKTTAQSFFPAGIAAAPSISFQSDANTGVWQPAADTIALSTGGVERARLNASGQLGLGTGATIADQLHVRNTSGPAIRLSDDNTSFRMRHFDSGAGQTGSIVDLDPTPADGASESQFRFFRNVNTTGVCGFTILRGNGTASANSFMSANSDSYLNAGVGNVGIGKTTPTTRLDVNGPVRVGAFTVAGVPSASTSGAGAMIYVSNETGGAVLAYSDGANWRRVTDRAIIS